MLGLMKKKRQCAASDCKPANETEAAILEFWRGLPGLGACGVNDNFFESGGHSVLAAQLIAHISRKYGRKYPISILLEAPTVRLLAELVRSGNPGCKSSSLVAIRATGTKPPLFCIHGIDGNAIGFQPLTYHLPCERPIYVFESTKLQDDSVPAFSVEELSAHYISLIKKVQKDGPYVLAGYSAGGIVAYEMARQLRAADEAVHSLIIFDSVTPEYAQLPQIAEASHNPLFLPQKVLKRVRKYVAMDKWHRASALRTNYGYYRAVLSTKLQLKVFNTARRAGFRFKNFLSFRAAFLSALYKYVPQPTDVTLHLVRTGQPVTDDPTFGWGTLAKNVVLHEASAGHDRLFREPEVAGVSAIIERVLNGEPAAASSPSAARKRELLLKG